MTKQNKREAIQQESSKKMKEALLELMRLSTGTSLGKKKLMSILAKHKVSRNLHTVLLNHQGVIEKRGLGKDEVYRWTYPGIIDDEFVNTVKGWLTKHAMSHRFKKETLEKILNAFPEGFAIANNKKLPKLLGIGDLGMRTIWMYLVELNKQGKLQKEKRGKEVVYIKPATSKTVETTQKPAAKVTTTPTKRTASDLIKEFKTLLELNKKGHFLTAETVDLYEETIAQLLKLTSIALYFQ